LRQLPAQVQLAEKMRERGHPVSAGSRLEYVVTTTGGHKAMQWEKVESYTYFNRHPESLQLDYYYYLHQLVNPIDQILNIIYGDKSQNNDKYKYKFEHGFVMKQYKLRLQKVKILENIKTVFAPKIKFIEN
jgi:DNA polymerase elongation subunit (family B)